MKHVVPVMVICTIAKGAGAVRIVAIAPTQIVTVTLVLTAERNAKMLTEEQLVNMTPPPLPEGKKHLVYRDLPKMPIEVWEWMKEFLAPYELHILADARYERKNGIVLGRGQILVHPDGLTAIAKADTSHLDSAFNIQ